MIKSTSVEISGLVVYVFYLILLRQYVNLIKTGGRDTAGLGGRGGYKRFYKGGDIKQVSRL